MTELALSELAFDPNLAQDVGMDTGGSGVEDGDDDDGFDLGDYDDEVSLDEDLSWKVRRAAASLLVALFRSFPQLSSSLYDTCHGPLVKRFAEREETVKLDVLAAFCALVQAARRADAAADAEALVAQLRTRSMPLKTAVFGALTMLVRGFGAEWGHGAGAVPVAVATLQDPSSLNALKLEVLGFLQAVFLPEAVRDVGRSLLDVSGPLLAALKDNYYKVVVAALGVVERMAAVAGPEGNIDHQNVVMGFWEVVLEKLKQGDQDQQVKDAAIRCDIAGHPTLCV
jgi:cullin-associated NEDD8-dissociated protein 1